MVSLVIRTDANAEIGYGHLYRCLALSQELSSTNGVRSTFIMTQTSDLSPVVSTGNKYSLVPPGMSVSESIMRHVSPNDCPVLLDTYDVTYRDLTALRTQGYFIALFEDINRLPSYLCNLIIDSSPQASGEKYNIGDATKMCLGPEYYPLRSEFLEPPPKIGQRSDAISVSFGGSDPDDQTGRVLSLLSASGPTTSIRAILGPGYRGKAQDNESVAVFKNPQNLRAVFEGSRIALCGGGGTALELAYLGIPMIIIALAENQILNAKALNDAGAAFYLGLWDQISDNEIVTMVKRLWHDEDLRNKTSSECQKLVDGGGCKRLAEALLQSWSTA